MGVFIYILENLKVKDHFWPTLESGEYIYLFVTTCFDMFAPSYASSAVSEAGAMGRLAEERKWAKYQHLDSSLSFIPVAVEATSPFALLMKDLSHKIRWLYTGEENTAEG